MNVVVGSAFRDSQGEQILRYRDQTRALAKHLTSLGFGFRIIAAEGDSTDNTRRFLRNHLVGPWNENLDLVDATHGGPKFGSTEQPERMAALTKVGNTILEAVKEDDDILLYVESDLIWDVPTAMSLINLVQLGTDVVAPMVFAGEMFYDVYAFRKNGERFYGLPPYHPELKPEGLTEVDSVGSCLAMKAKIAREIRMPPGGVLVGWCDEARKAGYKINVASQLRIQHP